MAMMAYRATMFMIFFNYAMLISRYIGEQIFTLSPEPQTYNGLVLQGVEIFKSFGSVNTIIGMVLTAGVLALFAFSLLIPTIPFMFMFFALSGVITNVYLWQLPIPDVFKVPLTMGVTIIYYIGISQYASRSTLQGS